MIKNVTIFLTEPMCACDVAKLYNVEFMGDKYKVRLVCPKCNAEISGFPEFCTNIYEKKLPSKNVSKPTSKPTTEPTKESILNSGDPPWKK